MLTEQEKEIAIACADATQTGGFHPNDLKFADLFLSRIRDEQDTRKGYECVYCGMVYPDHKVTACDCLPQGKEQDFYEVAIFTIPPATLPSGNSTESDCKELMEALESCRGQWIHSIHAEKNLSIIAKHKASMGEE